MEDTVKTKTLSKTLAKVLHDQDLDLDRPGPIVRDFQRLLDFVGDGIEVGGKYYLLPMESITELDNRLSRPLHLELKRPQLRSHPYLQGLYLLLRATGLGQVGRVGSKARLQLDPIVLESWRNLNPTERYFNLLEAWLLRGRPEMVGEKGRSWSTFLLECLQTVQGADRESSRLRGKKPQDIYFVGIGREFYHLAVMDLFGLIEVEQPPPPVQQWYPAALRRLPLGEAVCSLLTTKIDPLWGEVDLDDRDAATGGADGFRFG